MNFKRPLILASSSPRRQYLMREAGYDFTIEKPDVDESFPKELPIEQVARYLASKKAEYFRAEIHEEVVITADTVVILDNTILNKPADRAEAIHMLTRLSGRTHLVMTGVCILSKEKEESFDDTTEVSFKKLSPAEIQFYVDTYKPFDKAGAYGAQDCLPAGVNPCSQEEMNFLERINRLDLISKTFTVTQAGIGMVSIEKIVGSYFNVMGLPIHKVYTELQKFI
jgi:septum formation protein